MDAIGDLKLGSSYNPEVNALKMRIMRLEDEKHDLRAEIAALRRQLEEHDCAKAGKAFFCPRCGGCIVAVAKGKGRKR